MLSGYSPQLLNIFCDKGIDYLQGTDSYTRLKDILFNSRYDYCKPLIEDYYSTTKKDHYLENKNINNAL